jgi:glycerate-2-kinase
VALQAMVAQARALELGAVIISDCLYGSVENIAAKFLATARRADAAGLILAGGEPDVKVPARHGRGGRNQLLTLQAMKFITGEQVFISFGSDGQDNGEAAGAIADRETAEKAAQLGLDMDAYLRGFDAQTFFEKTGDLIITGPTGANVSDLMLLLDFARI